MKLYFSPGACSLAPHIVLREAGLAFTLEKVDLGSHRTEHGNDFHAINGKGQVPVLELADGEPLTEGAVIARFLADRAGHATLLPRAGMARVRVEEWQGYVSTELHKSYTPLFNPALDAAAKATLAAGLRRKYAWVDAQLAGTRFLAGADFSVADAYLFTVTRWAPFVGLDLSDLAHLQAFMARVQARPAVHAALRAEGLPADVRYAEPLPA